MVWEKKDLGEVISYATYHQMWQKPSFHTIIKRKHSFACRTRDLRDLGRLFRHIMLLLRRRSLQHTQYTIQRHTEFNYTHTRTNAYAYQEYSAWGISQYSRFMINPTCVKNSAWQWALHTHTHAATCIHMLTKNINVRTNINTQE